MKVRLFDFSLPPEKRVYLKKIRLNAQMKGQTIVQVFRMDKIPCKRTRLYCEKCNSVNYFCLEAIYSFAIKLISYKLGRIILFEVSYGMNETIVINRLI